MPILRSSTWIRSHPLLSSLIIGTILFLSTGFIHPDPTSSSKFQFPGLFPSKPLYFPPVPPPSITPTDTLLESSPPGTPVYDSPRLTRSQERRYSHLRKPRIPGSIRLKEGTGRYMFTTVTRNIQDQLPDLLNTFLVLTEFLGADKVYFSFLEGPSDDETPIIIEGTLKPMLLELGVPNDHMNFKTRQPPIPWDSVNRITALAMLRTEAVAPLWHGWEDTVAIIFFNDIWMSAGDVLELLHQHVKAGEKAGKEVGMTSGMDWWQKRPEFFYDIWVARTIEGDLFYPIETPWWTPSTDLFSTSPNSLKAYKTLEPFQAFSTWNGVVIIAATPFLPPHNIRFRRGNLEKGECTEAECNQLASDFWKFGWGRVQIVPSVQVTYSRGTALEVLEDLGNQKKGLGWEDGVPPKERDSIVEFQKEPPEKVRCHRWPEANGLQQNVWEKVEWLPPWV